MENHGPSMQRLRFTLYIRHLSGFSEVKEDSFTSKVKKFLKLLQNHVHAPKIKH